MKWFFIALISFQIFAQNEDIEKSYKDALLQIKTLKSQYFANASIKKKQFQETQDAKRIKNNEEIGLLMDQFDLYNSTKNKQLKKQIADSIKNFEESQRKDQEEFKNSIMKDYQHYKKLIEQLCKNMKRELQARSFDVSAFEDIY